MLIAVPLPFSPLFPYTTLFRSLKTENDRQKASALLHRQREFAASQPLASLVQAEVAPGADVQTQEDAVNYALATGRSEEHTSELQSRGHLVCRLLLDKKKVVII